MRLVIFFMYVCVSVYVIAPAAQASMPAVTLTSLHAVYITSIGRDMHSHECLLVLKMIYVGQCN